MMIGRCVTTLAICLVSVEANAQTAPSAPADAPPPSNEIVVTAPKARGDVIGNASPEVSIGAEAIATYGAGDVGELLDDLAPQTGQKPVLLVNGKRISGGGEISKLPPEAIERFDILPEEVALAYGYKPGQKVVNIVLKRQFAATTVEASGTTATEGGRHSAKASVKYARLSGSRRLSLDLGYARDSLLRESERSLVSTSGGLADQLGNVGGEMPGAEIDPALSALAGEPVTLAGVPMIARTQAPTLADFVSTANIANASDPRPYRSLLPSNEGVTLGGSYSRPIGGVTATLTARYEASRGHSLYGLPSAVLTIPSANPFSPFGSNVRLYRAFDEVAPLEGTSERNSLTLGAVLAGYLGSWSWSATGNFQRDHSETTTERGLDTSALQTAFEGGDPMLNPFGPIPTSLLTARVADRSVSTGRTITGDAMMNGTLAEIPAGKISASVKAGIARRDYDSETTVSGTPIRTTLDLTQTELTANLNIPIASRRNDVLAGLGDLNLYINGGHDHVSDVGAADSVGAALVWKPVRAIRLTAALNWAQGLPPASQRADAAVVTPNVPVYDPATGMTVLVDRIDGGNPALASDDSRTLSLNATVKPLAEPDLSINLGYTDRRVDDPVGMLPALTPAIEGALPDRFTRDATGALTAIDARPLNFARSEQRSLNWGLFLSLPLGQAADGDSGEEASEPDADDDGMDHRRSRFGSGGLLVASLSHSWQIENSLVLASGVPPIDLTNGGSFGSRPAGRHKVDARINWKKAGIGVALDGSWQSAARLDAGGSSLAFGSLATLNAKLFADLGRVMPEESWARGARIGLSIANLFDARGRVTDSSEATPLAYQGAYLDPLGRTVSLSLRKQI